MCTHHITGPPSVDIVVDKICITSFNISLMIIQSHPACGNVSHFVTIAGEVIHPSNSSDDTKYVVDELQGNTPYNITVNSKYKSGTEITTQSVMTLLPKRKLYGSYIRLHINYHVLEYNNIF